MGKDPNASKYKYNRAKQNLGVKSTEDEIV